jgi:hypothetical protein
MGSAFVREAELWIGAQGDLLTGIETIMTSWMRRQRQAFEASSRSIKKMCDARNPFDLLQAQHEWISDCLNWTASEIRAVGEDTTTISRRAAERLGQRGEQTQTKPPAETAPSISVERAAERAAAE